MYNKVKICKDQGELNRIKEILERKDIPVVVWEKLTLIVPECYYEKACLWASTVTIL